MAVANIYSYVLLLLFLDEIRLNFGLFAHSRLAWPLEVGSIGHVSFAMFAQVIAPGEAFATMRALESPIIGVDSGVPGQLVGSGETLVASQCFTPKWFLSRVASFVSLQV